MMKIENRNLEIVRRALPPGRETFAAIGDELGISRERVRQIFDKHATAKQKRELNAPTQPGKALASMSRREPKVRIHLLTTNPVELSHDAIRAGVSQWIAGRLKIDKADAEGDNLTNRLDILLPETLESKFRQKCDKVNLKASAAIRAIIATLETEK